jgi:hypothetical protein
LADTFNKENEMDYEILFRDAYEKAFGVRPVFSVDHLSNAELQARIELIEKAATGMTGACFR